MPQNWKQVNEENKPWYIGMGYYSTKNNKLLIHTTWVNLRDCMLSEETSLKDCTVYNSIYMTFVKRQNYSNGEQVLVARGWI